MLPKALAGVLFIRLVVAPLAAAADGDPASGPIAAAAAREAADAAKPARGPMPTGLKWTGIGLLIYGGAVTTAGLLACSVEACGEAPEIGVAVAVGSLLAGVIVLQIADRKRVPVSPQLVVGNGRAMLRQRITF